MSRHLRIGRPPTHIDPTFAGWLSQLADSINALPGFLLSDRTLPNDSGVTGLPGTILINITSEGSRIWISSSTGTTSWLTII